MAPVLRKAVASTAAVAPLTLKNAISGSLSDMVQGGLAGDFWGTVKEARTTIWNYDNGNGPLVNESGVVFTLAVRTVIAQDGEDESDVVNYWSAGSPEDFVPSMDGETPSPLDEAGCSVGICFIPAPGAPVKRMKNNTNYAQALEALTNAGFKGAVSPDYRFWEGLHAHWDRVPQKKRSGPGMSVSQEGGRAKDILVPTALGAETAAVPVPATAAVRAVPPARPAGAPPVAAAPAATPAVATDFDETLAGIVVDSLPADGSAVPKGTLASKVLKAANLTPAQKAKGVARATSAEFLNLLMGSGYVLFDADAGTVALIPQ